MRIYRGLLFLFLLLLASPALAQQEIDASKLYLGVTGSVCQLRTGSGSPEGAVTGTICDEYIDTATSDWYSKSSGSGNTGWSKLARLNAANVFTATQTIPTITAAADLTLNPASNLVTDPAGNTVLPALGYEINLGTLQKKYLTLHAAELWVETLVAQQTLATIGGRILVGPTNVLQNDALVAGCCTYEARVKYNNFTIAGGVGDIGYLEANGNVEFVQLYALPVGEVNTVSKYFGFNYGGDYCSGFATGSPVINITGSTGNDGNYAVLSCSYVAPYTRLYVTSIASAVVDGYLWYITDTSGGYRMLFSRDLDGSGANAWYAGDAIFNTGRAGNGFMDLYSVRGIKSGSEVGPTIVGNVRTGGTYNAWAPRWAAGRLDDLYGYSSTSCAGSPCYGFAAGDYTKSNFAIDSTNGFKIRYGANSRMLLNDTSLSFWGPDNKLRMDLSSSGYLAIYGDNTNTYMAATSTGIVLVANTVTKVAINNDGTATFSGDGDAITNIDGGNIQASSITAAQIAAGSITSDRLLIGSAGSALNDDPFFLDTTAWALYSATRVLDSPTPRHGKYFVRGNSGAEGQAWSVRYTTLDAAKKYRLHAWYFRDTLANGNLLLGIYCVDADGTPLATYYPVNITPAYVGGWVEVNSAEFTANTCHANTASVETGALLNWYGNAGYYQVADLRLEEVLPSTLISNGAIITDKLAANAVTAAKIAADTITANEIAANAITTSELNADSVTSAKIAANTITASDIAAGTITATEIAANTITAAKIAAGTITGTEIAASTITAAKLSVSTLSAISADLGTVTAGTISGGLIDGATMRAGTGDEVVLDSSGITVSAGTGSANKIKFSDGSSIVSYAGTIVMAGTITELSDGTNQVVFYNNSFYNSVAGANLGAPGTGWGEFYFNPTTTASAYNPLVLNGNQVLEKTDGDSGTGCGSVDVENGIVVTCGAAPVPAAEFAALKQEVEMLKMELAALIAERKHYQ